MSALIQEQDAAEQEQQLAYGRFMSFVRGLRPDPDAGRHAILLYGNDPLVDFLLQVLLRKPDKQLPAAIQFELRR